MMRRVGLLLSGMLMLLTACGEAEMPPVAFQAEGLPAKLSDWHVVEARGGALTLNAGVVPFDLVTPLFTDYAHKLRTVWMPEGTAATFKPTGDFDWPVGTIFSKTFYYPRAGADGTLRRTDDFSADYRGEGLDLKNVRMIETRILAHRADGWVALAYVWNTEQTEASLEIAGEITRVTLISDDATEQTFPYIVPNKNQCSGCHAPNHTTKAILPIGPKARHLNKDYAYASGAESQLGHWASIGYLNGYDSETKPFTTALWTDESVPVEDRARAYIDINCGHCHNSAGAADTSGLWLNIEANDKLRLGYCKPPVAAGQGSGGRRFTIQPGQPDASMMVYRMASTDPGAMMPELGRSTIHDEGVTLIRNWIATIDGDCK